jgi:hypothetical protein
VCGTFLAEPDLFPIALVQANMSKVIYLSHSKEWLFSARGQR